MIWFFFRVLFSCRFLFHIFIIIIIVSLAIVFAMRARYGFNSNWTRQNSARTAWLAVLCSTHGLSSIKSTKYRKRSYKKTVFIIERIIEMLFIINETIFNSNFGNFFFLLLSISVELSACCVYFIFFWRLYAEFTVFFSDHFFLFWIGMCTIDRAALAYIYRIVIAETEICLERSNQPTPSQN